MSETEYARCFWHNVDEPYTAGVDYKACGECWHVWPTEAAFRASMQRMVDMMNAAPMFADEPTWTVPADLTEVYSCPLCAHDF